MCQGASEHTIMTSHCQRHQLNTPHHVCRRRKDKDRAAMSVCATSGTDEMLPIDPICQLPVFSPTCVFAAFYPSSQSLVFNIPCSDFYLSYPNRFYFRSTSALMLYLPCPIHIDPNDALFLHVSTAFNFTTGIIKPNLLY